MSLPTVEDRPYLSAIDRTNRGKGRFDLTSFYATPGAVKAFCNDVIHYFGIPPSSAASSSTSTGTLPNDTPTNSSTESDGERPDIDAIIGLDALGFPLAGALSVLTDIPVILARKGGKLALPDEEVARTSEFGDYAVARVGVKSLEIRRDLLKPGMKVLIVDEWIDTGSQMTNLCNLLESLDVIVVGLATFSLREGKHPGADALWERYEVFASARTPVGHVAKWARGRTLRRSSGSAA